MAHISNMAKAAPLFPAGYGIQFHSRRKADLTQHMTWALLRTGAGVMALTGKQKAALGRQG